MRRYRLSQKKMYNYNFRDV